MNSVWNKLLLVIALIMTVAFMGMCKSSSTKQIAKSYHPGTFNSISLQGAYDVELCEGAFSVQAVGNESAIDGINIEVKDKCLELKNKRNVNFNWFGKNKKGSKRVLIKISAPAINKLELIGSGNIKVLSSLHPMGDFAVSLVGSGDVKIYKDLKLSSQSTLKLDITGSGDIEILGKAGARKAALSVCSSGDIKLSDLVVNQLSAKITGSGDIDIAGQGNDANLSVLGSGDIDAYQFQSNTVQVSIMGSGDVKCNVQQSLKSDIMGSGSVYYKGNPKQVNDSGLGKAKKKK